MREALSFCRFESVENVCEISNSLSLWHEVVSIALPGHLQ
jgi:hypothetical protein